MSNFKKYLIFTATTFLFVAGLFSFIEYEALAVAPGCVQGACTSWNDPPPYCTSVVDPPPYCTSWGCTSVAYPPPFCASSNKYGCTRIVFPPPYCANYGCTGTYDPSPYCAATYDPPPYCATYAPDICPLSVSKLGTGSVAGPGISCGSDCGESYNLNTSVTLTPSSSGGYVFGNWVGACSGSGLCSLVMDAAKSVNAVFNPILTVTKTGTGNVPSGGIVISDPTGISCGATCSNTNATFPFNAPVILTPIPAPGYSFAGWQGACAGAGVCSITMDAVKSVNALFYPTLVIDKSSPPAGTITSNPSGINCDTSCKTTSAGFAQNSTVTLTAVPAQGYRLAGWRGACEIKGSGPCVLNMDAAKTTVAIFEVNFSVNKTGSGNGVVVAPGIECGTDCSEYYPDMFSIPILANPFINSIFAGWQGDCAAAKDNICLVAMNSSKTLTAKFDLLPFLFKLPSNLPNLAVTKKASAVSASSNISQTLVSGAAKPVTLSVSGLPTGVTASIGNNSCKAPCVSNLNFSIFPDAPNGIYPVTITGQADNVSTTTLFNLIINAGGIYSVRIVKAGTGAGTVTLVSNDPKNWQVVCKIGLSSSSASLAPACSSIYARNSNIIITAVPDAGSIFSGWSGDCGGTGTCPLKDILKDKNITANFKKQ